MIALLRGLDRHLMAARPAARLGAVRLLCGGFALAYILARLPHFVGYAHFHPRNFRPVGVAALLDQPLPWWAATALTLATAAAAVPFFLGWRFRVTGPLFAALFLWTLTYRHSWGMIFHTDNLLALHVAILGLCRSADAWSLDARRAGAGAIAGVGRDTGWERPALPEHGRYGWPLRLMCWVVVIAYVLAGVAKLDNGGAAWMWGDALRNHVAIDNARKALLGDIYSPLAAPLLHWSGFFKAMAFATVALELGAPLALVHVRAAAAWVILVVGFHLGVLALMMIAFPYQMLGVAFAPFFPVERLLAAALVRVRGAAMSPERRARRPVTLS